MSDCLSPFFCLPIVIYLPLYKLKWLKNMKTKNYFICCAAMLLTCTSHLFADNGNNSGRLDPPSEDGNKPKTLIPEWIEYSYNNGVLLLKCSMYIENVSITIKNESTGFRYNNQIENISQPIYIDLSRGNYTIECIISSDIVYQGVLIVN